MQNNLHEQGDENIQADAISQALNATLDPRVSYETRQQALEYLEQVKRQLNAPYHGFSLAQNEQHAQAVRYYGLQLLEYAVKYQWSDYSDQQTEQVRVWITTLARNMSERDASFYRNKVGQLWVDCAKRSWGEQWLDMDMQLCEMWDDTRSVKQPANRILVLYILEMLAEDICNREDATAGLRLDILGSSLNEIVIPEQVYQAHIQGRNRDRTQEVRHGHQGWLARICSFLADCMKQISVTQHSGLQSGFKLCATKSMNALRAFLGWISLKAIVEVRCISCLFLSLHIEDVTVRTAAIETLHTVLARQSNAHFQEVEIAISQEVIQPERVTLLASIFQGVNHLPSADDDEYTLQKKTSEVLSVTSEALWHLGTEAFPDNGIDELFRLLLEVFQSQSLIISIPILHSWTKLFDSQDKKLVSLVMGALGTLVDTCSQRLINYELLPEDSDLPIVQFLYQDFETMPERHAFLGNYRRYCIHVIETISKQKPIDAINHVFGRLSSMLSSGPYSHENGFRPEGYSKSSQAVLEFDAQFTVALSVIKGFAALEADFDALVRADPSQSDSALLAMDVHRITATEALKGWCRNAISFPIADPEVAAHVLTILSNITRGTMNGLDVVFSVVDYLLSTHLQSNPSATAYTESLKGFEALRVLELQKIALTFADELFDRHYEHLERKVGDLIAQSDDDRIVWGLRSLLFIIVQRTTHINDSIKTEKLRQMIDPVVSAWQDRALQQAVTSTDTFCDYMGLRDLPGFYQQHRFDKIVDWASELLDAQGEARQAELKTRLEHLPLRMTKSLLGATTEKLKEDSRDHEVACAIWGPSVKVILPTLLQMIRHAQAFGSPARWSHLSPELQAAMKRTLQDRFWQSGISNETREEFYARISGSKTSYEGFASSVRGLMRNIREQGYHIVFLFTKFEEDFYGLTELPDPLASALFDDADALSTHHVQAVINLATGLIQRCPPQYRQRFLPPLLTRMIAKMDAKISNEWQTIVKVNEDSTEDDDLSEEMRIESVLRQLTFSMVSFVAFLLDYEKQIVGKSKDAQQRPTMAEVVLSDVSILEPLIMFCTHALRMRDTRCCTWICKILSNLLPQFAGDVSPAPEVREFISTEVLKAAVTSLNEPYFADMQKDLAALLAQIIYLYSSKSPTPRNILLSLPYMQAPRVDSTIDKLLRVKSARGQRALILDLLEGVRGVSIHESGKIARTEKKVKVQAQYMELEQKHSIVNGDDVGLDAIGGLFGDT